MIKERNALLNISFFVKFSLLVLLCQVSFLIFADETVTEELNDKVLLEKLNGFEEAFNSKQTAFFRDNFSSDAKLTVHTKQRETKNAISFSKKAILDGELFERPNILAELERNDINISYYNDNTQALLTYKLLPKKTSKFRIEKGYLVDNQILFQIVQGSLKIVKVISHIDLEPNYKEKQESEEEAKESTAG